MTDTELELYEERKFEALKQSVAAGDTDITELWKLYERERGAVRYGYKILAAFDNYGSGSLDTCVREVAMQISEARTRIDQLIVERDEERARVTELQKRGTELENERRMWKLRAQAAQSILSEVFSDLAVTARALLLDSADPLSVRDLAEALKVTKRVAERVELLEKDAWTQWAPVVREFVRLADGPPAFPHQFIADWKKRFEQLLG